MSLLTKELRKAGSGLRALGAKLIRYAEKIDDEYRQRELAKAVAAGLVIDKHGYLVIEQEAFRSRKYKEVPGVDCVKGIRVVNEEGTTVWTMVKQRAALLDDD